MKRAVLTALALLPLTLSTPAHAAPTAPAAETAPLSVAISRLAVDAEDRTGYKRTAFRHWNSGLDPRDGCNTRQEVLISEAQAAPTIGAGCKLAGGEWWSYYDETRVVGPEANDIDHTVALGEAWDSGASAWTVARREAYANDQDAPASLVAVTARSNRAKGDKDPADWLPPAASAQCRYAQEWTSTKLRWNLAIDEEEQDRLYFLAAGCTDTVVTWEPAP
ncbi:HNH endonuclease family protein [Streptomyces uncialis]|uniref:HNH endonuclease family protein n=1 Tax=Streptomyces uncialis TaxID=1048205 RepID=UPI003661D087